MVVTKGLYYQEKDEKMSHQVSSHGTTIETFVRILWLKIPLIPLHDFFICVKMNLPHDNKDCFTRVTYHSEFKFKSLIVVVVVVVFYIYLFLFLFYFILFYFILFYFILFYFILFYFILFYFILFYFILFYFILFIYLFIFCFLFCFVFLVDRLCRSPRSTTK